MTTIGTIPPGTTKQSQIYVFFRKCDVFHGKNGCDCEDMVVIAKLETYSNCYVLKYSEIVLPDTLNPLKYICTTTNCTTIGSFTLIATAIRPIQKQKKSKPFITFNQKIHHNRAIIHFLCQSQFTRSLSLWRLLKCFTVRAYARFEGEFFCRDSRTISTFQVIESFVLPFPIRIAYGCGLARDALTTPFLKVWIASFLSLSCHLGCERHPRAKLTVP